MPDTQVIGNTIGDDGDSKIEGYVDNDTNVGETRCGMDQYCSVKVA